MRQIHRDNVGGIKEIESMAAKSEFNFLIIFHMDDNHVSNSDIHSHTLFGYNDRNGEQVNHGIWVVVHFKVGDNI